MSHRFVQWTYLLAVAICASIVGYAWSQLNNADHVTCRSHEVIIANQRLILNTIIQRVHLSTAQQVEFDDALNRLESLTSCRQ